MPPIWIFQPPPPSSGPRRTSATSIVLAPPTSIVLAPPTSTVLVPPSLRRSSTISNQMPPVIPAPPPMPSGPPPPPPLPGTQSLQNTDKKALTADAAAKLDKLRQTPRKRPDWTFMMKEVEQGVRLKHIKPNDRSKPILPVAKARGKFLYESENHNVHNQLLNQIQRGVRLKRIDCNDRSRPNLQGLRKILRQNSQTSLDGLATSEPGLKTFRRQLTVEEQIQKIEAGEPIEEETEELEDIDQLRDDLQSTKQLLELEVKQKESLAVENRNMKNEMKKLQDEVEQLRKLRFDPRASVTTIQQSASMINGGTKNQPKTKPKKPWNDSDDESSDESDETEDFGLEELEQEMNKMKGELEQSGRAAVIWEQKCKDAEQDLVLAQANLEDMEMKCIVLERKLKRAMQNAGSSVPDYKDTDCQTDPFEPDEELIKKVEREVLARQEPIRGDKQDDDEPVEEEDEETKKINQQNKELRMVQSKLKSFKEKEKQAVNERGFLKQQIKKFHKDIRDVRKKHKELKKQLDKFAKQMQEVEDDDDDDEDDEDEDSDKSEKEEEEVEEEEEEEEETEESSSEEEDELVIDDNDSETDDIDGPIEGRIDKYYSRTKRHEEKLTMFRKGNLLLKQSADKIQEELRKERETYLELDTELNTMLAELG